MANEEFFVKDETEVWKREPLGDFRVAYCSAHVEGCAEQIVRALNRLPQAEALLIATAQAILHADMRDPVGLEDRADQIEDWMVNG